MRVFLLAPVLAAAALVLGAWASMSKTAPPACTAHDKTLRNLVPEDGYTLACGPGSAIVRVKGATYRIRGGTCFRGKNGGRLYFGAFRFNEPPPLAPQNALYLVIEPNREGAVDVLDGGVDLTSGLRDAIVGKAHATARLRRGTFTIFRHLGNGVTHSPQFTGTWNCG